MKKLIIIAFIGLFAELTHGYSTVCMNGTRYSCDGSMMCTNGRCWCNGVEITSDSNNSQIKDAGKIETKEFPLQNIDDISVEFGELTINQCENPLNCIENLMISADRNVLPYIKHKISGNKLELGMKDNVSLTTHTPIKYHVTVKDLHNITTSGSGTTKADKIKTNNFNIRTAGSGDVMIQKIIAQKLGISTTGSSDISADINTDKLNIHTSGSGDVSLSGHTNEQKIHISGSGSYNGKNLESNYAHFSISGSGDVGLNVKEKIEGHISGSGSGSYSRKHDPKVNVTKSGSGSFKKSSW